ncbi:MAG: hypothetical protein ACKO6K_06785 [Chitinophagaceae bacterium]
MLKLSWGIYLSVQLLTAAPLYAQDVARWMVEARQAEKNFQDPEALSKYLDIVKVQPHHLVALCRASELSSKIGKRFSEFAQQKNYFRQAQRLAERALEVNPQDAEANFVMSVALGRMALIASGEDKVKAVKDIKKYAERSIRLDPGNYKGYHVLGKWHYEVSSLTVWERWLVKLAFGAFPEATFAESIRNYEISRKLNPALLLNYLEEAKACYKIDDKRKALELLRIIPALPNYSSDDPQIRQEAGKLLQKWKN